MTAHRLNGQDIALLREEVEMLMAERGRLLRVVGAAAVLIADLDPVDLPEDQKVIDAAEMLAEQVNRLPEETLREALGSVHAEPASSSSRPGSES